MRKRRCTTLNAESHPSPLHARIWVYLSLIRLMRIPKTARVPVSIFPSRAAGPSRTRLLICRNSSGSSPPTTVNPKPLRLFFSLVLMKVPFSSAGLRVKKGLPPEAWVQTYTHTRYKCVRPHHAPSLSRLRAHGVVMEWEGGGGAWGVACMGEEVE